MNDELKLKLIEFGDGYRGERITNFGEYASRLNAIVEEYGFSAKWDPSRLSVIVTHGATGKSSRMRVAEIQIHPGNMPIRSVMRLEDLERRVGTTGRTVIVRNRLHNPLVIDDREGGTFDFEFHKFEEQEVPADLLDAPPFRKALECGYAEIVPPLQAGMVRLDLDRIEARHALRSLRRTMEIVLNLTETEGETEEDRHWRYVSYGMTDARRLADALETAIGPEQTLGCPECNGYGLGEGVDTCGRCGGEGCGECSGGAVQVQVPCGLCGGSGEIPESVFD